MATNTVTLKKEVFDHYVDNTGKKIEVTKFIWVNPSKVSVEVITYGATITAIKIPDKDGNVDDIVMGFADMKGYQNPLNPYFGSTVGRVCNRIGNAKFKIADKAYTVTANHGAHQLHGGNRGFDKVNWEYAIQGTKVILSYLSKDGEEGFPGDLITNITFELTATSELKIDFQSCTTKPTYVNLTNHSYFNLAGHNKGTAKIREHMVMINADKITIYDKDAIPTGKFLQVEGTTFDLRVAKKLGDLIDKVPDSLGYDHNFCLLSGKGPAARVVHPGTKRVLEVYTDQPGLQFYTANYLPEDNKLIGKEGPYLKQGAFCLEAQNYPDAINHQEFPNAILFPGQTYRHCLVFKFLVQAD